MKFYASKIPSRYKYKLYWLRCCVPSQFCPLIHWTQDDRQPETEKITHGTEFSMVRYVELNINTGILQKPKIHLYHDYLLSNPFSYTCTFTD
jgi:hypothetical protein